MTITLRTPLAKRHFRVIESAPADLKRSMIDRAVSILYRTADNLPECSSEGVAHILDAEAFSEHFGLVNSCGV